MIEVKIENAGKISRKLNRLKRAVERRLLIGALRGGAAHVRRIIKGRLPVDPSDDGIHLNKSLSIQGSKIVERNTARVSLGYIGKARFYGHLIEFGGGHAKPNPVWRSTISSEWRTAVGIVRKKAIELINKEARR